MNNDLLPLIVDLDDTLVLTDTLHESIISLAKIAPTKFLQLPFYLSNGKAEFKSYVAKNAVIDVSILPYRTELLEYIKKEKALGRKIVLATAANETIANSVAEYLGCFDEVISTTSNINLKGENKLIEIKKRYNKDFIYAGDHYVDIVIWEESSGAIVVGRNKNKLLDILVKKNIPIVSTIDNPQVTLKTWLKAIRLHQWLKNLLFFIPLLTSFQFLNFTKLFDVILAFIAFSLGASATYILNDLWDLANDRQHIRKFKRPFASGVLSVKQGIQVAGVLLLSAFILSSLLSFKFLGIFILYLVITTLYSLKFKKEILIDITILSILYTIRIVAGTVVAELKLSYWLITFSVLIFLSLATMKRCAELVSLLSESSVKKVLIGRGYQTNDLELLYPLGISTFIGAILIFGLYINDTYFTEYYNNPSFLWFAQLILFYLVARLWFMTKKGFMHDDPVVYLVKDKKSWGWIILFIFVLVIAHGF